MSNSVTVSIVSMYNYDDTIFDAMVLPTQVDKPTLVSNLLLQCAEQDVLYPDIEMLKSSIGFWSAKNLRAWQMYADSLLKEDYDPFTDYDRNEIYEETRDLSDEHSHTGTVSDSGTHGGTVGNTGTTGSTDNTTQKVAGFNSESLVNAQSADSTHSGSSSDTTTYNETQGNTRTYNEGQDITHSGTISHTLHQYGNSALGTNQDIIEKELRIRNLYRVYDLIIRDFKNDFLIQIY